jgi:hypothetical protein
VGGEERREKHASYGRKFLAMPVFWTISSRILFLDPIGFHKTVLGRQALPVD